MQAYPNSIAGHFTRFLHLAEVLLTGTARWHPWDLARQVQCSAPDSTYRSYITRTICRGHKYATLRRGVGWRERVLKRAGLTQRERC